MGLGPIVIDDGEDPKRWHGDPPGGTLSLRTLAMPADTNPHGDVFGGWLMGQMDIAGAMHARQIARGRVATVGVNAMTFHKPVYVGDELTCYTQLDRKGQTSLTMRVAAWVRRADRPDSVKVTEGLFVFVALDSDGRPRSVRKSPDDTA